LYHIIQDVTLEDGSANQQKSKNIVIQFQDPVSQDDSSNIRKRHNNEASSMPCSLPMQLLNVLHSSTQLNQWEKDISQ
jgi:hypothetical protein